MAEIDEPMLSLALKPSGEGWAWWVIDEAGLTVAEGVAADRAMAQRHLRDAYAAAAGWAARTLSLAA